MALDFALSDEQKAIQKTAADVLDRFRDRFDEIKEAVLKHRKFPQDIWDALSEAGFLGSLIPETYGGTGMGITAIALAVEELARRGFGNTLLILTAMDSLCIVRNGSEEMKRRILPQVASGKLKLCFALTEPDAGSNTFRIKTVATKNGTGYDLSGEKVFITGADVADRMLVVARTTSREDLERQGLPKMFGLSLFIVDTKAKGLKLTPLPTRGIEGMTQFTVHFDNVHVSKDDLIGEENMGSMALFNSLNPERILAAATACGITDFLLEKACSYARDRKVFKDRPIGSYQAIQHPLAEIKIDLEATRLLAYKACWSFDRDDPLPIVGSWANMAKFKGAELAIRACDQAIETFGGYGFSEEYHIIYLWDTVRLLRTAPITREMILNYTAEHVLDLPRSY